MTEHPMWTARYQPKSIDECVLGGLPESVRAIISKGATSNIPPNLLLLGAAGTGKTSIARLLCYEKNPMWCYGARVNQKELERRFSYHRNLQMLVVIDDADLLTKADQNSIRALIEKRHVTSWIFAASSLKNIIEPIASRLIQIDLTPKSGREDHLKGVVRRCQQILHAENIRHVSDDDIYKIADEKYPDMRRTINELQSRYMYESEASLDVPELVFNLQEERIENEYAKLAEEI